MADLPPRHRAAARAGAQRRLHHDDHQRPEGVRHRARARARVDAVERERDRARDVAHRVSRAELRPRLRHCGVPLPARDPRPGTQHPPLPERDLMAAAAPAIDLVTPQEPVAVKILRVTAKAPVHLILVVLGAMWLVPTFGLLITSLLPAGTLASKGWWVIFSHPSLAT